MEARYAILFDGLGLKWEYEKEGYSILGMPYLPDFYIPEKNWWIEIKGKEPTDHEDNILHLLGEVSRASQCFIFFGNPVVPYDYLSWEDLTRCNLVYPYWDNFHHFCQCPVCGKLDIQFEGRGARVCGDVCVPDSDREHNINTPFLINAFREAVGARFEFDEHK